MPKDDLSPLRPIEGFPIGEDDDLHALSDPPHYTAYPNPHLADFIQKWGKPYDETTDNYHREPYVADVAEGKNDPIYNAHSYHTKVPYKAIIPFIEHYTQPGDLVFDGFCGTGMTGVAAQMTGRRAILCDLSPAATFIAYNYNTPVDSAAFEAEAKRILQEVEAECGWMYETKHPDGRVGRINYTVWSDVFICPYCGGEIVFWDAAVDQVAGKVQDEFSCPSCNAAVNKRNLDRAIEKVFDSALGKTIELTRQVPVLINYSVVRQRYDKRPEANDLALIAKIEASEIPYWFPTYRIPEGDEARRNDPIGMTHVHHFYTRRNLWVLAAFWHRTNEKAEVSRHLKFILTSAHHYTVRLCRLHIGNFFGGGGGVIDKPLEGTLYMPSISVETNAIYRLELRSRVSKIFTKQHIKPAVCISTQSSTANNGYQRDTIDYIFTDPPFGSNLMYSELNFLWEAWLRIFTNNASEAVINQTQRKDLASYRELMTEAFVQMNQLLKPGRWITVVFHNSRASVWNAIQEALARAGFLVAQVTIMDKQKGSFKQVTSPGSVKNDLIINAYKPFAGFSQKLLSQAGWGLEADFVRQHLEQLPLAANVERSKEMLYSKYLAYYVQHGYQVAYNGQHFYQALPQWGLVEQDGYWFSDEAQARRYVERLALNTEREAPQAVLFISDERSAIQWLKGFLRGHPSTLSDIQPAYFKALQTSADLMPDLRDLLVENFGPPDSAGRYHWPHPQLQASLEETRHKRLLAQFEEYLRLAQSGQRLKEVRQEALVAGFTEAYRAGRFQDILTVGKRLDKRLLEDNPDLFDFVDIAEAKVGG